MIARYLFIVCSGTIIMILIVALSDAIEAYLYKKEVSRREEMARKTKKPENPYRKKVISYQKFYANQKKFPGYYPGIKYNEYVNVLVTTGQLTAKTGKKMLTPKKRVLEVDVKREDYKPIDTYKKSRTEKGIKELKRTYNKIVKSQAQRNKALKRAGFKPVKIKELTGKPGSKEWRMGIVEAVQAYTSAQAEVKRAQADFDRKRIAIAKSTGIVIETKDEMRKYGEFMSRFKNLIEEFIYDSDFVAEEYYNDYEAGKKNFEDLYLDYIVKLKERGNISESQYNEMAGRVKPQTEIEKYRKQFAHYKHKSVRQDD